MVTSPAKKFLAIQWSMAKVAQEGFGRVRGPLETLQFICLAVMTAAPADGSLETLQLSRQVVIMLMHVLVLLAIQWFIQVVAQEFMPVHVHLETQQSSLQAVMAMRRALGCLATPTSISPRAMELMLVEVWTVTQQLEHPAAIPKKLVQILLEHLW